MEEKEAQPEWLIDEYKRISTQYKKNYPHRDFNIDLWGARKWMEIELKAWRRLAWASTAAHVAWLTYIFFGGK